MSNVFDLMMLQWFDWGNSTKTTRKPDLITGPVVRGDRGIGLFENDHWAFVVPFAFREALDIRLTPKMVGGKSIQVWTQGPSIRFRSADSISERSGDHLVHIDHAEPMQLTGSVIDPGYVKFTIIENTRIGPYPYQNKEQVVTDQITFLSMLIFGLDTFPKRWPKDD